MQLTLQSCISDFTWLEVHLTNDFYVLVRTQETWNCSCGFQSSTDCLYLFIALWPYFIDILYVSLSVWVILCNVAKYSWFFFPLLKACVPLKSFCVISTHPLVILTVDESGARALGMEGMDRFAGLYTHWQMS